MKISDVSQYSSRWIILCCLLGAPFLRMLIQERYGFAYPEVAAALLFIIALAAVLAAIAGGRLVFFALVVGLTIILSVNALQVDFFPSVRFRLMMPAIAVALGIAMWVLKEHFYRIFLIFIFGGLLADVGKAVAEKWQTPSVTRASSNGQVHHVVHLVLDGMMGLAAMPPECDQCRTAANEVDQVLERGNFQIYPYAFSNYQRTIDSIPSILNGHLLDRPNEYVTDDNRRRYLRKNRYFDSYLEKKFAISVYQSDYMIFSSPEYPSIRSRMYRSNSLKALHSIALPWSARLKQLFAIYIESDPLWWDTWMRFTPEKLHPDKQLVGPVALEDIWPDQVLRDCISASKSTLFFVHLLTPHYPYAYRPDGSLRDPSDWNSHEKTEFTDDEAAKYRSLYELYGGQTQFVAKQLEGFIQKLKAAGLYDSTTVIVHGDHGSRMRLLRSGERGQRETLKQTPGIAPPNTRFDYFNGIDHRDLLNRFGTLLAIKLPGQKSSQVITERGSVLYFLQRAFRFSAKPEAPEDLNSAYLFNIDGSPHAIPTIVDAFPQQVSQGVTTLMENKQ